MTRLALLGVPHDENSSFHQGPAQAPPAIRRELYSDAYSIWSETGIDLGVPGRLVDHGDLHFDGSEDAWTRIEREAGAILATGTPLISLGGDHAITHPLLRAAHAHHPSLTLLHIDAHADIYHAYQGNPRSHASPFARIMEEGLASRLIQLGLRTVNDHHREQWQRFGVEAIEAAACGERLALDIRTPIYLSVDIDAFDPAYAPGVSHREPGGLTPRQVIGWIQALQQPVIAADIVEYNPRRDWDGITATLAAKLLKEIAGVMLRNRPTQG
ncbi:agmatinase family protein [Dyella sp. 2RAB6]|uniref:agmatinase family protein n=1 Tax=Dyella sp. 2RAB6 TaxID=3232992 RepID=UPI003F8E704D